MVVDLWRRNFNPKVPKQSQAAKMLRVCARLCFSHKFLPCVALQKMYWHAMEPKASGYTF